MSLHTLTPATLSKSQQQRLIQLVQGSIRSTKHRDSCDVGRGTAQGSEHWRRLISTDDNEGSFFTARGTVRSVKPKQDAVDHQDGGEEEVEEQEVLVLVHDRGQSAASYVSVFPVQLELRYVDSILARFSCSQSKDVTPIRTPPATHLQEWSYGESPGPSRVLYLFHPPSSTTNNEPNFINPLSLCLTSLSGVGSINLDAWSWLDSARESLERAFWGILMPSVSGVVGVSEKVSSGLASFITLLPIPATLAIEGSVAWQASTSVKTEAEDIPRTWARDATYKFQASASLRGSPVSSPPSSPSKLHAAVPGIGLPSPGDNKSMVQYTPRLYDQETLYTLRLPPTPVSNDGTGGPDLELGPTMKPIHVKKRASLPWHTEQHKAWDDGKHELGLGMAPGGGMGLGMGMRV
ncbi:hypothetical protein I316_01064 [Kwoniella heveanensis BCC8398]|uniref:Uncharacterized protein n=1 Tax=Kwoniella heveanensis BCC8398 TaxID=1296120 RepID=A0A1B9H1M6_9TREE|nr:hypothetical protein I316_01064 [Kwoniella heveanensis BCC8398]